MPNTLESDAPPKAVTLYQHKSRSVLLQEAIQGLAVLWCMQEGHLENDPEAHAVAMQALFAVVRVKF